LRRSVEIRGVTALIRKSASFTFHVEGERVDALRFTHVIEAAQKCERADKREEAARLLHDALDLWRGDPLEDVLTDGLRGEAARLEELRVATLGAYFQLEIDLGRHAAVIAELRRWAKRYSLNEQLHAQLMLALYRSGRSAEALDVYHSSAKVLSDELGLCPSPMLRDLERAILLGATLPVQRKSDDLWSMRDAAQTTTARVETEAFTLVRDAALLLTKATQILAAKVSPESMPMPGA
jgi:serine/threonine-protein kinase PknK